MIRLEVAGTAVVRLIVRALVADDISMNKNYSCKCSQYRCCCCWLLVDGGEGVAGRYATINCDVDVLSMVLAELT